jgi:hypothetical protein
MTDHKNSEIPESRHSVTEPQMCRDIAKKYGWKLLRIERTKDPTLKFNCVFEGETQFPNYLEQ